MQTVWRIRRENMNLTKLKIGDLLPNPWNPNEMNEEMMSNLIAEIRRVGYNLPILARPKGDKYEIIDGEHRWLALKALGNNEVEVLLVEMDDYTAKTVSLNMNKLHGQLNLKKYAEMISDIILQTDLDQICKDIYEKPTELSSLIAVFDAPVFDGKLEDVGTAPLPGKNYICPHCGKEFNITEAKKAHKGSMYQ
jgi:ParB/RepB/Spo0J family partition protein